jgi:transposase
LLKAKKKAEAEKKPAARKLPQAWSQKRCPKCGVEVHVRKKQCDCGFAFFKP